MKAMDKDKLVYAFPINLFYTGDGGGGRGPFEFMLDPGKKKFLVSTLLFADALIMFNYYTYHFTEKSGFRQNFMSHGWRNKKEKRKNEHIYSEKQREN